MFDPAFIAGLAATNAATCTNAGFKCILFRFKAQQEGEFGSTF